MKAKSVMVSGALVVVIALIMTACAPAVTNPVSSSSLIPQTAASGFPSGKADFKIKSLDVVPSEVVTGQSATATVIVTNTGAIDGTYVIMLRINGTVLDTKEVEITPGSTRSATFAIMRNAPGTYEIKVEDTATALIVKQSITTTIASITPITSTADSNVPVLHQQAWRQAASNCGTSNYYKYSIYSARSLAVANPEVYLQADKLWMDMTIAYGGWGLEYSYRDRVLIDTNYWDKVGGEIDSGFLNGIGTDSFHWSDFQWEQHRKNAVDLFSYYKDAPTLNWVDNRLMFLWDAMNGTGWGMPYTSLAEFEYLRLLAEGKHVYLVLTDDRKGYVAEVIGDNVTLEDPVTGKLADTFSGTPLIVMNNGSVWYPLMRRDDTGADKELSSVVQKYCRSDLTPKLAEIEKSLQDQLRSGTKLNSDLEFVWAKLLAIRAVNQNTWRAKPLRELSAQVFVERYKEDSDYSDSPSEQICLGMVISEMGNRLSPITALWADSLLKNSVNPPKAFQNLGTQYLQKFHRTDSNSGWVYGEDYRCWLPTLDDKLISGVGDCIVEATNCMAVLSLANVKGWEIYETNWWTVGSNSGHAICGAYTSMGGFNLSNGLFNSGGPLSSYNGQVAYEIIYSPDKGFLTFVQTTNAANYSPYNIPYTKLTYTQTNDFLQHVKSLQGDTLIAKQQFPCTVYTISEYIDYLSKKSAQWEIPSIRGLD